jgi:DNA modification methylase
MGLIRADARFLPLVDGCVQTCVTSPPYFGLRDYGSGNQIGLEPSPDAYVQSLLTVFAEVWRVLKDDGTCWLNLGDSFAGSWGAQSREHAGKHAPNVSAISANQVKAAGIRESGTGSLSRTPGLKSKDLIGIPWRVAFALQAVGWYLRSDIIWSKPNPMPESVTDRPTKAHEYIFLLSKQERYYYDAAEIREPHSYGSWSASGDLAGRTLKGRHVATPKFTGATDRAESGGMRGRAYHPDGRNKRSVWHVATQPYSGSHFATFPQALIEPCILAGSRPGDLVLDPFIGSGTVGAVCERFGRRWVGTDLSYQHLAKKRTKQRGLKFSA